MASEDRQFAISIDINAPVDRVYEVMSEVERWHEWTPSVKSIKRLDSGPFVVGSRVVIRQPKFPPALWKVTAIGPGLDFSWENVAPGVRVAARHRVEPITTGSRVSLSLEYFGLLGGVLAGLTR